MDPKRHSIHYSTGQSEHYTPPHIIELAQRVLGPIDLDPCSNSGPPVVPANCHYTAADNGLNYQWHGTVYMNPPYGRHIRPWIDKLRLEYRTGHVSAAIALLPARTDTQWFLAVATFPIVFVTGRLRFGDAKWQAPFPSAIVYMGAEKAKFLTVFGEIGVGYIPLCP